MCEHLYGNTNNYNTVKITDPKTKKSYDVGVSAKDEKRAETGAFTLMETKYEDLQTTRSIYQKKLDELFDLKNKTRNNSNDAESILNELKQMSFHPRYDCIIPITENAYTDATLINTEFMVKRGDFTILTSQNQTFDYIEDIIKSLNKLHDGYSEEHKQINERLNVLNEINLDGHVTKWGENAYTVNHGDLVEIIEVDDEVTTKGRLARFKTAEERDEYVKSFHKSKTSEV